MDININYLEQRLRPLKLKKAEANEIINLIVETHEIFPDSGNAPSLFRIFIDFFFLQLLESFLQNRQKQTRIFLRLGKIHEHAINVNPMLWVECFAQLDPEILNRIYASKDTDLFWYQYAEWFEKNINQSVVTSMVLLQNEQQTATLEINNKVWLTIEELSKYADIAVGTIYNYVSSGDIPHTKKGGLKFNRQEIDGWLKSESYNPDEIKKQMKARGIL